MLDLNLYPLYLSLKVATTSTFIGILIGLPIAYFLSRTRSKLADILDSLIILPIILPPTVLGYYLLVLFGRNSVIGAFLEENFNIMIVFTPAGAVIAATVVSIPFLIKSAKASFSEIDESLIQSARVLGKSEWKIFTSIILPLSWTGIISGVTLSFARAIGDFGATLMIAGSIPGKTMTMPIAIYDALMAGDRTLTNTLVFIMTVLSLIVIYIINRLEKKTRKG